MSTPRDILGRAYTTSKANKGAGDIDEPTEGLAIVQGALNRLYTITARVRPDYFGKDTQVPISSGRYPLPPRAERVYRIEKLDTTEVVTVPRENRTLYAGRKPAVFFTGRAYEPAGNVGDPTTEDLVLSYAPGAPLVGIDDELADDLWPSQHDELLVYESATYLSLKDRRVGEDLAQLKEDRDARARLFITHLDHVNSTEIRRTGIVPRFPWAMVDLLALLAGNSPGSGA